MRTPLPRALMAGAVLAALAGSVAAPAGAIGPNAWTSRRVLNIAHQGGEIEAPSNTLFAFKTSLAKGADVLELDVHATSDRELVVLHDATVDRTTNGTGSVDEMTLEQIKELDAAYDFVPDCGTCGGRPDEQKTYRGIATGDQLITEEMQEQFELTYGQRFEPNDFKIPTLREVLETFPDELINIEIKATAPDTEPYEAELAALLQEFDRGDDTIVVSFIDTAVEIFELHAPEIDTATGTGQAALFYASSRGPSPGAPSRHQALQVPIVFNGIEVVNQEFVDDAHASGLAVHVWTINDEAEMRYLVEIGVDGIMTDRPELLEEILSEPDVRWEPGS